MAQVVAINGSPRGARSSTERILAPFLQGLSDGGETVQCYYTSQLRIGPCSCGRMACWDDIP